MRQRLGIIASIVVAVGILIAINSAAYVRKEDKTDSEVTPMRSTYHAGPTGTRALFDFLAESGYSVIRWREAPEKLLGVNGQKVKTFVYVGSSRLPFEDEEVKSLRLWIQRGGRLVLIDRRPNEALLPKAGEWKVVTEYGDFPTSVNPGKKEEMTEGIEPVQPSQPTPFTRDVANVMPSRFFSAIRIFGSDKMKDENFGQDENEDIWGDDDETATPVPPEDSSGLSPAPVVHLATTKGPLLVDYPYGKGRIVFLSDPFMVANGGISLNDNLQLALNMLSPGDGLIAFDEFHQGHGATHNAFVNYFQGTPVLAIGGQIVLLILLVLWTRGRRFARPLPLPHVDRRSSLEFVASMAELQQRARSFDLAIENIYSRTRRVLARYAGVDYNSSRKEIAERVAARSTINAHQLETLMRQSEDAINGESIGERQSIQLVKRLREVETTLGLRMRSREVKQAQKI